MFSTTAIGGAAGPMPSTPAKTCQTAERKCADPKFIIQHRGQIGNCEKQLTSAAAFFARTSHKASPVHSINVGHGKDNEDDCKRTNLCHVSDFAAVLGKCPPPVSPLLLKKIEANEILGMGKVRVILRVANSGVIDEKKASFFRMDKKKRQVTLFDPSQARNSMVAEPVSEAPPVPAAPKMFAFDGLFTDEDPQIEVCANALVDPIHAVVQGTDAALFTFGHVKLGKTYTMIGSDESSRTLGIIPTAIAWLYRAVKEKKEKTNTRFSIRVSALEIGGPREEVRDLLLCAQMAELQNGDRSNDGPPPSTFLSQSASSANAALLPNQAELRCPTSEKAGDLLDAALTARSTNMADDVQGRDSHFVFTLHVYQYSVDGAKNSAGVIGGRSRLHLVDFGSCDRTKTSGGAITISGLGNVILSIFNGQRHLPCKESKVTQLLKECLGSLSCQATMIAHVSPESSLYSETLHTTQLASRIHRMRRKKAAKGSGGSAGGSGGSGSSDENRHKLIRLPGHGTSSSDFTTSTDPSSSEQSCDTVIYVGSRDDDGTDAEHPPVYLPSLNSGDNRGQMAKVLRGSTAEMPKYKSSTLDRKKSKESPVHSPTSGLMAPPQVSQLYPQFPSVSIRQRPGSVGSTPTHNFKMNPTRHPHLRGFYDNGGQAVRGGSLPRNPKGKMPLTGKVAGYRQPPSSPHIEVRTEKPHQSPINQPNGHQFQMPQQIFHHPMSPSWTPQQIISIQAQFPMETAESIYAYGFMDDHKKMMIQQWVECQTAQIKTPNHSRPVQARNPRRPSSSSSNGSHHHHHHHGPEPEPFAWLNQPQDANDVGDVRCLTQFKTVDSSDDSVKGEDDAKEKVIAVDIHAKPQKSRSTSDVGEKLGLKCDRKAPRDNAEDWIQTETLDDLYRNCEKLVESLNQEDSSHHQISSQICDVECDEILSVTVQGGGEHLPDINEIEILTFSEDDDDRQPPVCLADMSCQVDLDNAAAAVAVQSSDENLASTVAALDVKSLHYVNNDDKAKTLTGPKTSSSAFDIDKTFGGVCDDAVSLGGGEDYFSKKLDQLAKLHELYQSVSSISAKCQSHLDAANKRQQQQQQHHRGSSFSLKSEASSTEVNSLCSEPARMYDYADFVDVNKNGDTNAVADMFNFGNGTKFCMSLGDLGDLSTFGVTAMNTNAAATTGDRCDSPVLEGIDGELAKYAKLKDLKHAYEPSLTTTAASAATTTTSVSVIEEEKEETLQRKHPEGSSDPDLNRCTPQAVADIKEPVRPPDPPPCSRRSPGNGRSGSEADEYERPHSRKVGESLRPVFPVIACPSSSPSCSSSLSSGNGNQHHHHHQHRRITATSADNHERRNVVGKSDTSSSDVEITSVDINNMNNNNMMMMATAENEAAVKTKKAPKFSRLFKISRSPLKVSSDEKLNKKRSKSADVSKKASDKKSSSNKISNKNNEASKNAAGTSSSESSRLKVSIPSPYSIETAPIPAKGKSSSTGSDSGHESGTERSVRKSFIKSCTFVKLRSSGGRGASKNSKTSTASASTTTSTTTASTGTTTTTTTTMTPSKKKTEVRASHCKSSGYESGGGPGFDSERESVNSLKAVLNDKKITPVNLVDYDEDFVSRLDARQRFCEVRQLQKEQEGLKVELRSAKNRINADPKRWSFDLHVAENLLSDTFSSDPSFVEALKNETKILRKRVAACKSHATVTTCFDFCPAVQAITATPATTTNDLISAPHRRPLSPLSQKLFDNCCTTDCECLLTTSSQETEIF